MQNIGYYRNSGVGQLSLNAPPEDVCLQLSFPQNDPRKALSFGSGFCFWLNQPLVGSSAGRLICERRFMVESPDIHFLERRRFPRYACTGSAEIFQSGKRSGWGTVIGVSRGGCCIETTRLLPPGTEVQLDYHRRYGVVYKCKGSCH